MGGKVLYKKEREINTEIIRIIACLSVIALHTFTNSGLDEISLSVKGIIRIFEKHGVPLFMMITGYYLFSSNVSQYKKKYISLLSKIIIPFLIAYLFYECFAPWLEGINTFWNCLINPQTSILTLIRQLISEDWGYNPTFWYIFEYVKIYVYMPLLALMCKKENKTVRRGYMFLCMLFLLGKNVSQIAGYITGEEYKVLNWSPLDVHMVYVLIGYEVSDVRESISDMQLKQRFECLLSYVFINITIAGEEFICIKTGIGIPSNFFSNNSLLHVFSATFLFLLLKSFKNFKISGKTSSVVTFISDKTYYIYLIHYLFIKLVSTYNIFWFLSSMPHIIRYSMTVMMIFILSFLLSIMIKSSCGYIKRIGIRCSKYVF